MSLDSERNPMQTRTHEKIPNSEYKYEDTNAIDTEKTEKMKIYNQNIRGLNHKDNKNATIANLVSLDPDIAILTETYLRNDPT